jgi:hypothetical protein
MFSEGACGKGYPMAVELDDVPLPNQVKDLVRATWQSEVKDRSGRPLLRKPSRRRRRNETAVWGEAGGGTNLLARPRWN